MKQMGIRIQQKREECGMTQEDLGKRLGVSRQTICKWEAGAVNHFDRSYVSKMADIFHCSAAWLMGLEGSNVVLTYEAPERETVKLTVNEEPIMGESSLRAKLFQEAIKVRPENLQAAIDVLKALQ